MSAVLEIRKGWERDRLDAVSRPRAVARRLALPGLLLLTACCYWEILYVFFVQDDFFLLVAARAPAPNGFMWRGVCFFRPLSTYWLPLLNVSLWGLEPFGHHLTLLLLFLATVAALYFWLRGATHSITAALAAAALYAFSKTHLYTLAWIAGGIDVSAALFLVLCLWAVDRCMKMPESTTRRRRRLWFAAVGVALVGGLLCKESCVAIPPACLVWLVVDRLARRQRWTSADWKLAGLFVVVTAAYLPLWKVVCGASGGSGSRFQFDPTRALMVLRDSVIAVVPVDEAGVSRGRWWLLLPAILIVPAALDLRRAAGNAGYFALGLSLWVLPAAIFMFTKYPWTLQLYYGHFSVIGLAILAALAVWAVQQFAMSRLPAIDSRWNVAKIGGLVLVVAVAAAWLTEAGWTIRSGVRRRASPALAGAELSRAAYEQLSVFFRGKHYQRVVFLDLRGGVWASMHHGSLIPVFFPEVKVACDGWAGFKAPPRLRTTPTTLVVRQTGKSDLTVVR